MVRVVLKYRWLDVVWASARHCVQIVFLARPRCGCGMGDGRALRSDCLQYTHRRTHVHGRVGLLSHGPSRSVHTLLVCGCVLKLVRRHFVEHRRRVVVHEVGPGVASLLLLLHRHGRTHIYIYIYIYNIYIHLQSDLNEE